MAWDYTNDYSSTILAYLSGAGTITVVSVTGLPASGRNFILKVDDEYFLCTSYTGLVLTVTGGQAGSTPANHSLGAVITGCWIVPSVLDGIRADQSQIGTYANLPTTGMKTGDQYKCTDFAEDYYYNGSAWISFIAGPQIVIPPTSSWTWDNQGSGTVDASGVSLFLTLPLQTGACNLYYRSAPSTPYTITAGFMTESPGGDVALNFGFRDSSGKFVFWHVANNGNIYVFKFSSSTSPTAPYVVLASNLLTQVNPKWLQITDDGTNLIFRWRLSPYDSWQVLATEPRTDYLSSPTYVCFGGYVNGGIMRVSCFSWLQS